MRVLMATMQLGIGGAETHIVELSKALKKRGIEVFVASQGGEYVSELETAGIKHFKLPLNKKTIPAMRKSLKGLKEIIEEYKIDVVHSHARIPGFILANLRKSVNFRLVSTAHWVFKTGFPYNYLTNWGDRSLSVSDDIKKYLMDNYGIDEENIRITINGIDTEKFSKDTDFSDIKNEFDLKDGKRIVYVSRMDEDRSLAAKRLIECAGDIKKEFPDIEIVIVGGGNDLENVRAMAEKENAKAGENYIKITGGRTDINKFVASGDIFVGVSRAALEAMAAEKPCIIAGNEGYIGIFDEDKLEISRLTNFCCRGCEETTAEKLKEDVINLLKNEDKEALGRYGKAVVEKYYSIETMADDALKMYVSVIKGTKINEVAPEEFADIDKYTVTHTKKKDVLISGYYGYKNSGDDSVLKGIVEGLKRNYPAVNITVLSRAPKETREVYGVEAISRFDFVKIYKAMKNTKLFISGGGSLLQDVTSRKSLAYYVALINMAKKCKTKTMVYANGIGPVNYESSKKKTKEALRGVDIITLRENSSFEELKNLGIEDKNVTVTADPVFLLEPREDIDEKLKSVGLEGKKFFCISVRNWKKLPDDFADRIGGFANKISERYGLVPVFIPMQISVDGELTKEIMSKVKGQKAVILSSCGPEMLMGILKKAEFVLGMRLHILIYSAKAGTPVIGLDYDPKVRATMEYLGQDYIENVEETNVKRLELFAEKVMEDTAGIRENLMENSDKFKKLAEKNAELAIKLLRE
ncbi:MAG: polysaccharide pyruvyl transferase CsaB [Clostridia bacterium]|nr:polysaccharide pyruvyl transferase CsaB [Clostridia bacterium]